MMMDNFDRHVWEMVGGSMGVLMTALFGWPAGVGWLIGYGIPGFVVFGIATGRIVIHRKRDKSTRA